MFMLFLMGLFLGPISFAFESFPQYKFWSTDLGINLPNADKLDSEYQSDALSFAHPYQWEQDWLQKPMIFQFSAGSISSTRFNIDNRLRLENTLTEDLIFRFLYLEESNLDLHQMAHLVELEKFLSPQWSVSAYGEVMHRKSGDDLGISLSHHFSKVSSARLFYNLTDFSRNERNEEEDEFTESPKNFGFLLKSTVKNSYWQWVVREESKSIWQFPEEDLYYIFDAFYSGSKGLIEINADFFLGWEAHFNRSRQQNEAGPASIDVSSSVEFFRYELRPFVQIDSFIYGIQWVDRNWRFEESELRQKNLLPYIWWYRNIRFGGRQDRLGIGWENTYYESSGPIVLRATTDKDYALEQRANLSYSFGFNNAEMRWLFTFDLDRFGTGESWEGGAGQMTWQF